MGSYINKSEIGNIAPEFQLVNFKFFQFHNLKNIEFCLNFDAISLYLININKLKYIIHFFKKVFAKKKHNYYNL